MVREGVDTRTIIIITMATEPQECRLRRSVVFAGEIIIVISAIPLKNTRNELRQLRPINYALNALNRIILMVPATTRKTAILANRYVTIPHCVPLLVPRCALCRRQNGPLSCCRSHPSMSEMLEIIRQNQQESTSFSTVARRERMRWNHWYRSWVCCRLGQMPSTSSRSRNQQVCP